MNGMEELIYLRRELTLLSDRYMRLEDENAKLKRLLAEERIQKGSLAAELAEWKPQPQQ